MDFLASIICWLFLTCTAEPPVILHRPIEKVAPKEFTIETVGASYRDFLFPSKPTKPTKPLVDSKPKSIRVGAVPDYPRDWARIENGVVQYVTFADKAWIDRAGGVESGLWMEVRKDPASTKDDADIGDTYRADLNAFIPPKPTPDATLDEVKAEWVIPAKVKTQAEKDYEAAFFTASST